MLHLSDSNGSAIMVKVNDARIQQRHRTCLNVHAASFATILTSTRRFDEGGTIATYRFGGHAETHVADGALRADKNREIGDGKDHRAFEDSPVQVFLTFFANARTRRPNPGWNENERRRTIGISPAGTRMPETMSHFDFVDEDPIGLGGAMSVSSGSSIPTVELESFVYGGCA
ncbi:hypothetical protein NL676_010899 [Syzygium grande]|nr:hypothetical protein NL676_010899 [Syzygium grande]